MHKYIINIYSTYYIETFHNQILKELKNRYGATTYLSLCPSKVKVARAFGPGGYIQESMAIIKAHLH